MRCQSRESIHADPLYDRFWAAQTIHTGPLHYRDMDKHVLAAIIWPDKAEAPSGLNHLTVPLGILAPHAVMAGNVNRSLAVAQPLRGKVKPLMRLRGSVPLLSSFNEQQDRL